MEVARRAGLPDLAASKVHVGFPGGAFPAVKVPALVAGADSIDDLDVLRHSRHGPVVHRGACPVDVRHVPA